MKEIERLKIGRKRAGEVLDVLLSIENFAGSLEDYSSTDRYGKPLQALLKYSKDGFEMPTGSEKKRQEYSLDTKGSTSWRYEVDPRALLSNADDLLTYYNPTKKRGQVSYEYLNFKIPYKIDTVIEMLVEKNLPVYMKEYRAVELFLVAFTFNRDVLEQTINFYYDHKQ